MDVILGLLLGFFFTEIERRGHPANNPKAKPLDQQKVLDMTYATDELQQRGRL